MDERERTRIDNAASKAIEFLKIHEGRLNRVKGVSMQSDMKGREGDVRDVVIDVDGGEVGISAKHRHKAVKHSRLSPTIDFGQQWYGKQCSSDYWQAVEPVFSRLEDARAEGKYWRDLQSKAGTIYAPIVTAFIHEIRNAPAEKLLRYMLGQYDYYKVVKANGDVVLESFNLGGSLGWGKRPPMPKRVVDVEHKRESTAIVIFDEGWSLSFRLHNAESLAMPTVKFDITLVGTPEQATHSSIRYR